MEAHTSRVPEDAYRLRESLGALEEGALGPDGTVHLHVMRPCVGRGRGDHLYEADMLQREAGKFAGWKMYVNHLSEAARRALGGLPRDLRDYGGRVLESWWDPTVPADQAQGFGQGAVVARVRPSFQVRPFIEDDPHSVEASINARATAVKPAERDGRRVWAVEGIEDEGSIDWVSEAGAGGRVVSLLESAYHESRMAENELLESMTDDEFLRHLRERRPGLLESIGSPAPEPAPGERVTEPQNTPPAPEPPDAVGLLREALSSDEGRELVRGLMEADIREEGYVIRAQAEATARREVELERMKAEAHRIVREAKLPAPAEEELLGRYEIDEAGLPSAGLDVVDEVDGEGQLVKRATERLREAVQADVKRSRDLIEALSPTSVRGQGGEGDEGADPPAADSKRKSLWRKQLEEAGFEDPDKVYDQV